MSRILLVEDNEIAQLAAKDQLERLNCFVDIANNGKQALELIKKNNYQLIFMDIGLPDMSGYEVTQQIRKLEEKDKNNPTPIIALSAHIDENHKRECFNVGMQQVLNKPLDEHKTIEVLNTYIKKTKKKDLEEKKSSKIDLKLVKDKLGYSEETAIKMLKLFMESLPEVKKDIQKFYKCSNYEKLKFQVLPNPI